MRGGQKDGWVRGSRRRRAPAHFAVLAAAALLIGAWAAAPASGHGRRPPIPIAPFLLDPDTGLFGQFGYDPPYTRNVPAFDSLGRPYIRSRTADPNDTSFVHALVGGEWVKRDFLAAVRAAYPDFVATIGGGGGLNDRVVFDREDRMYTLLTIRLDDGTQRNLLLTSTDYGASWRVDELPPGSIACEYQVGHNTWSGPPFLAITRPYRGPPAALRSFCNTLWVTKPYFDGAQLVVPDPVFVTNLCFGMIKSAGGASFAVTIGSHTHFVWAEATAAPAAGSPTYAATYYSVTNSVGEQKLLTTVLPANDTHMKPGIVNDSQGYLHVLTGAHGGSFEYLRSLRPDDVWGGWTAPIAVLGTGWLDPGATAAERGSQTYLSFDCDPQDTLKIVFRQWRKGVDGLFPGESYGALSYQCKPAGQPWQDARPIVLPPVPGYSIYYQKTALDRLGRLWISCSYLSGADVAARATQLALWRATGRVEPQPALYPRRMVIVMDQGRLWWHLATTTDFEAGVAP